MSLARRARYLACAAAVGGLVTGLAVAAGPGAAQAAATCQVTYAVQNDWGTGFTTGITIENTGPAITSWTLAYSYAGNQTLSSGWSGNWSQSGKNVTVTSASWNGTLATSATTQIGANFAYTGTNTAPAAFTLNGTTCTATGTSSPSPTPSPTPTGTSSPPPSGAAPMVSITSPTAGEIFSPGSAITLQAVGKTQLPASKPQVNPPAAMYTFRDSTSPAAESHGPALAPGGW